MTSAFRWTEKPTKAAILLADGHTQKQVAEAVGVTDRAVRLWLDKPEFSAEVDRLTLMMGIAGRAERLRIAKRLVRQRVDDEHIESDKDLLDWLKFAQSETDGIKLDLASIAAAFAQAHASLAGGGPDGLPPPPDGGTAAPGGDPDGGGEQG
jgi:predicted ArsR family transcriptional regulator